MLSKFALTVTTSSWSLVCALKKYCLYSYRVVSPVLFIVKEYFAYGFGKSFFPKDIRSKF